MQEMKVMKGVEPFPSEANFILFRVKDPAKVYGRLLEKGILVRNLNSAIKGCLRVTVGLPGENDLFLGALRGIA
jgi:histidinol-phosphate aminotransferase